MSAAGDGGLGGAEAVLEELPDLASMIDCTQALSTADSPLLRPALLLSATGHLACAIAISPSPTQHAVYSHGAQRVTSCQVLCRRPPWPFARNPDLLKQGKP